MLLRHGARVNVRGKLGDVKFVALRTVGVSSYVLLLSF